MCQDTSSSVAPNSVAPSSVTLSAFTPFSVVRSAVAPCSVAPCSVAPSSVAASAVTPISRVVVIGFEISGRPRTVCISFDGATEERDLCTYAFVGKPAGVARDSRDRAGAAP